LIIIKKCAVGALSTKLDFIIFSLEVVSYLKGRAVMKQLLWCSIITGLILCAFACSKKQMANVFDDISRDTYENHIEAQRIENIEDQTYQELPAYDQYQRERKELISDTPSEEVSEH
jgi:hypothetical protein